VFRKKDKEGVEEKGHTRRLGKRRTNKAFRRRTNKVYRKKDKKGVEEKGQTRRLGKRKKKVLRKNDKQGV